MPTVDINLLPESQRQQEKIIILKKRLEMGSVAALVSLIVVVVAVFSYWGVQNSHLADLQDKIKTLENRVNSYQDLEAKLTMLKAKTVAAQSVLSHDPHFLETLRLLSSLLAEGDARLTNLSLSDDQKLTLTAKTTSAARLGQFTKALKDPDRGGKSFDNPTLDALTRDRDGAYAFSLSLKVKR